MHSGVDLDEYFVTHPSNRSLATHTLSTAGQTPEAVGEALVRLVRPAPSGAGHDA